MSTAHTSSRERFALAVTVAATLLAFAGATASAADEARVITILPPANSVAALPGASTASGISCAATWPVNLHLNNSGYPYTPTLFDIDGDGKDEIFVTGGNTFGLRGDGTFLPGWPTTEQIYMGYGTNGNKPGPSGADVNGDGVGELMWTLRDWWAGSAHMWCFNGRKLDGSNMPGFPQYAPNDYSNALDSPFVLGDTNGDGLLEAWGTHTLGNNFTYYRLSGFDYTGTRLFTTDLPTGESIITVYFGDLNGDGHKEMFAVSLLAPQVRLHAFDASGVELAGFPVALLTLGAGANLMNEPPLIADLDHDGDLEIILGWWDGTSYAGIYHHTGAAYAGYPIQIATGSQLFALGLGDITGDGRPELLATDNTLGYPPPYRAFAFDLPTGTLLPGWPAAVNGWPKAIPTVVDVDNDGVQEMVFVDDLGELLALHGNGQLVDGYPKMMHTASISGVAAGDIDGDGLYELVASTWDGYVYAWDTPTKVKVGRADWPMRGVNARNTGVFGDYDLALGDVNCDGRMNFDDINPFVLLLSDPAGYALAYPGCNPHNADFNRDGHVNFDDINGFVGLLAGV